MKEGKRFTVKQKRGQDQQDRPSPYGTQVVNDFFDLSYDGPCPPPQFMPVSQTYVFTAYALDIVLPTLPPDGASES